MAMPILVCLGTTAVLELRRMAMRGDEGRALDELRASEQKLTKILQVREEGISLRGACVEITGLWTALRERGNGANWLTPDQPRSPLSGSKIQTVKSISVPSFLSRPAHAPSLRSNSFLAALLESSTH